MKILEVKRMWSVAWAYRIYLHLAEKSQKQQEQIYCTYIHKWYLIYIYLIYTTKSYTTFMQCGSPTCIPKWGMYVDPQVYSLQDLGWIATPYTQSVLSKFTRCTMCTLDTLEAYSHIAEAYIPGICPINTLNERRIETRLLKENRVSVKRCKNSSNNKENKQYCTLKVSYETKQGYWKETQ